MMKEPQRT